MSTDNANHRPHGDILVVEDNTSDLKFLSGILTKAGYRVRPAGDGELALRSVRARLPDLILLDVKLPGMNGVEVCRRLKADPGTRDLPVIFLSALGETDLKVKALDAGGIDYVTKPIEPSEVLVRISIHLKMHRLQRRLTVQSDELIAEIKERKGAEEALRESELWVRNIFKSLNETVFVITPDRIFLDMNEAALEMFGYTKKELLNVSSEIVHIDHEHYLEFGKKMEEVLNTGGITNFQSKMRRKNGGIFPTEHTASLMVDNEGKPIGIVSVIRDLSEQKKIEEEKEKLQTQLQQAKKMEAIGTLAGGIAHDFNNLLMGMQGRVSLMQMGKDASYPDSEHLKGIEDNVKSAADLTKQLLGFAQGGKYEVKPTNLNDLVKKSADMFGRTKKEIKIHKKSQKEIWTVEVDQGQIEQVLLNLYINAWQAMSGNGEIYLETENVTLDENYVKPYGMAMGKYVKISVTGTGSGMDMATQERVFDPFFTTKEMGRGTGLGLASAYGIIKNHNGIINVYSEKGKGTTFNIYMPATDAKGEAQRAESERLSEILRGTETVLLVDDEEMIIDVGKELLGALGYTVFLAKSGKEAIEIYKKNKDKIDMVLLDMIMPEMGGSETYERLKEIDPDIKVLLSSGYGIDSLAKTILAKGCDAFIQKPFSMKDLSQKLREILDKKQGMYA